MMESVREDAAIISCLQNKIQLSVQQEHVENLIQNLLGPDGSIAEIFRKINNEVEDMMLMKAPETQPIRGRKKKEAPRPDAIPEENEDGEDIIICPPPVTLEGDITNGVDSQDTTISSTTNRPRRAAVDAAAEKIKRMTEISATRKLRRPSDFNQNDHGNYNVYNQTTTKIEECFPRTKRRKGSGNSSVVTSSHFFSSTMIHSSPIQKVLGPGTESSKGLEMSIIPPHTEEPIMEVEESCSTRTRTRTLRHRKHEEEPVLTIKEERIDEEDKGKENVADNIQDACDTDGSTTGGEESTLRSKSERKGTRKVDREKSSKKGSSGLRNGSASTDDLEKGSSGLGNGSSSTGDSECTVRTRTRTVKKPTNKPEDLPMVDQVKQGEPVRASPVKTIGEKIREKIDLFENGGTEPGDLSSEGRVTRTKTRKMNKSAEDEKTKSQPDLFKVPLAVKNVKDTKKPAAKKGTDKIKDVPVVDPKQAALDERKRLREERVQKAAAARDQAEKEKRENALKLEREREEKLKLKRARDEKLKEEMEKKRQATAAKIEQQKREQDAARAARLQEIMEEENRKEAQRKKEQELQERKAQQAKLQEKLKANKPVAQKKEVPPPATSLVEERNYSISEDPVPSDEDEENTPRRPIPSWAKPFERNIVLADQIYLAPLVSKFFENPADFTPSVIDIFGAENVRLRPRTSSAVWNQTVCSD